MIKRFENIYEFCDRNIYKFILLLRKGFYPYELLTDIDMLLMVGKGIRGGKCHAILRYAKTNNKYMKNYDKNKESSYIQYLDANNLYGWEMSQKLLADGVKWKKIC